MNSVLELIHTRGLDGDRRNENLESLNKTQIIDFLSDLEESSRDYHLNSPDTGNSTIFNFAAPADLGGGRTPCAEIGCRLKKIDQLARFAILYADSIRVINPVMVGAGGESFDVGQLRTMLSDDLAVLMSMAPLIEDGLIRILPSSVSLCPSCFPDTHELRKRIKVASRTVIKKYLSSIKITRDDDGENTLYEFVGPEEIFEHGTAYLELYPDAKRFSVRAKSHLVLDYMSEKIDGIISQDAASDGGVANYLITSEFEAEIFNQLNPQTVNDRSLKLMEGLRHSFPVINSIDLDILKEIRNENHDSFVVYRDAVTECLNSTDIDSAESIKRAVSNQVLPEVNRLTLAINNSKSRLKRSLARDFVITSAVVTVGLFAGIVPAGLGGLLAAAGGLNFLHNNAERLENLLRTPIENRDNKFYFLWKVRQDS